ncbi:FAD-dependent oxidoreductase [Sulfurovum sp. bin170]|uniref:FAD-dependent oxidoreductase n=1 Tax=Sulfurovum sp. bin170 TaxID=2695268 RepID=UPI0013E0D346|nr:FAD-dependent oxidoreductase [Sulfurovum sp. bin170]NEW61360.1 FAD-dependent oxidoreductase [Sulfurovum sp. bin170]
MKNRETDILIIGAGPAGMVAAMTAIQSNPTKQVIVIKPYEKSQVPCGIPYVFGNTLGTVEKNAMPCGSGPIADKIQKIIDTVQSVDIENKTITALNHTIKFDKLIFATGSIPFVHKNFQDGLELENVFTIDKEYHKVEELKNYLEEREKVIVIGDGFIGVEMATELASVGKEVTLIGGRHILGFSFDEDMAIEAEEIMRDLGVKLALGEHAKHIIRKDKMATGIELCDGTFFETDVIILATGYQPNTALAKDAGLKLTGYDGIWVDEFMRTRNKDIFAVGDCSGRRDFITRDSSKVMLASTSAAEARVAGGSLYKIKHLKGFDGTIAIFSTMIGNRAFASAGVTEKRATDENIDYVSGFAQGMNRHPATIPDASKQSVKLIAMRESGRIIGGQVIGDKEAGEIINIIGLAIESKLTIHSLISLQVATQPLLTAAPTTYPIVLAAQNILKITH